jgi:hypothetical protein
MSLIAIGDALESLLHDGRETRFTLALRAGRLWCGVLALLGLLVALAGEAGAFDGMARIGALLVVLTLPAAVAVTLFRWVVLIVRSCRAGKPLQPAQAPESAGESGRQGLTRPGW